MDLGVLWSVQGLVIDGKMEYVGLLKEEEQTFPARNSSAAISHVSPILNKNFA